MPQAARRLRAGIAAGVAAAESDSSFTSWSWTLTSDMCWKRRSGSFRRHSRISRSSASGIPGISSLGAFGWSLTPAASVSDTVFPANARRPVTISYSTAPKLNTSLRASTVPPVACSGDMYPAVPVTTPGCVSTPEPLAVVSVSPVSSASADTSFARPKSSTFTTPSRVTITFAGLTSRWTMPLAWAAASASAIGIARRNASFSFIPCFGMRPSSVWPGTYSITMKSTPSADSIS
jgi:hypothetical protein